MSLIPRKISNFDEVLFQFIKGREGHSRTVYADINGVPTLGVGYAMVIFDNAEKPPKWEVRGDLDTQLSQIGITLVKQDTDLLQAVADALNAKNKDQAKQLINGYTFSFGTITENQARTLVNTAIAEDYAPILKAKIGTALYEELANSKELIALLSITYNKPSDIDVPLVSALKNSNRAEAWYEIRYESNGNNARWLADRRYSESNMFNLYDSVFNEEGAKEVMRMYTLKAVFSFQLSA